MSDEPLKILAVEDNPGDVRLLERLLSGARLGPFELIAANRVAKALDVLRRDTVDVIVLDLSLPDRGTGPLDALGRIRAEAPTTPVIMMTGTDDDELAVRAVREGAQDYLVKSRVNSALLARSIRYATERARSEAELVRLNAKLARQAMDLKEMDRRKDEFLAMLAHELRNPLAAIANANHVLSHLGNQNEQAVRLRNIVGQQVRHLSRMVDDLLDVSRVLRGKVTLQTEVGDLCAIVEQAVQGCRSLTAARHHEVELTMPPEPCWVDADPTRLEQVVSNLLSNATKFSEPGSPIRVTVERADGSGVIRVADTGKGIPREMLDRVFELFTQVDPTLDRSQGGLGIGLTLVQNLIELHGGSVEARSEGPGHGSEFVVRLPLTAAPPQALAKAVDAPAAKGRSVRVLLVEDNEHAAETLEELLHLWGHDVRVAHDGPSALAEAPGYRPEVVLLDLGLPGMDGYEVARRLRQQAGFDRTVIVALTGYGQEEDRQRTREAGFDDHLVKPVAPAVLKQALLQIHAH